MKTKLHLLLAVGLTMSGMVAMAQNPSTPPAGDKPPIRLDAVKLVEAIKMLADGAGLNVMFDPKVTEPDATGKSMGDREVTLQLKNVTELNVLNKLVETYGLTLVRDERDNIATVKVKDPQTLEPLVTRVFAMKYSNPTNIVPLIQSSLGARSRVFADTRTSQLVVLATEKELLAADKLINDLDTATKQVLIEGRIVETAKNPATMKGIDWSNTLSAQKVSFGNNALPGLPPFPGTETQPPNQGVIGGAVQKPGWIASTDGGFVPNTFYMNADGVNATLSFLNTQTDTEIVAEPRAVTLDNQPASLSVTRAFPIFKITPGSANSPAGAEITYTNLGTVLTVTPRIMANSNINLRVIPEVSNIDSIDKQVVNGEANTANIYAIRRIETTVMIPSGYTLVMGGLISDSLTRNANKVPILGDIPGLGRLFRYDSKSRNKVNLLIFITPTIVRDGTEDFQQAEGDFLKTKAVGPADEEWGPWDSVKPYDWKKPVY